MYHHVGVRCGIRDTLFSGRAFALKGAKNRESTEGMKRNLLITALIALVIAAPSASAQLCQAPLTAAAAGTNSTATGTFQSAFDPDQANPPTQTGFILTINFQGVTATAVRVRLGNPGDTNGQIITSLGGQTVSPVVYNVTATELQNLGNNPWYVVVESAAFPQGEIRMNSTACNSTTEGEGEAGIDVPEGFADYECTVNMNAAQVAPPNVGGGGTGTAVITPLDQTNARIFITHNLTDTEAEATLRAGAPGENGPLVRNLGNVIPLGILTVTYGELEDYTNGDFYIEIVGNNGGRIRGDIGAACAFDDGVPEGEGEGEGGGEGDVCSPVFPEGEPANLECEQPMTKDQVVPPSTSTYEATFRIVKDTDTDQYGLIVRHTIPDPAQIVIYKGAPGANGTPFRIYDGGLVNLVCEFGVLETTDFLQIIQANPHYIQITSESDANATLRADITCVIDFEAENPFEGQNDGEGTVDGSNEGAPDGVVDGEGTVEELERLRILADSLLFLFPLTDLDNDHLMSFNEVSASLPALQQADFDTFDSNDDGELTPGELHRYAGPVRLHNMDYNGDKKFTLTELLRVVQFYNSDNGYGCAPVAGDNEDGFEVVLEKGSPAPACKPHASDYEGGADFQISLTELLRAIQFFNFSDQSYGYASDCGGQITEDDFCPLLSN
ncbi:MAG: CHRD domain-containing protein [Candidatus Hydrogenedens sp.]|nr:CHRD domain-containing protein [Candidatus Hydrogenedens sp.]